MRWVRFACLATVLSLLVAAAGLGPAAARERPGPPEREAIAAFAAGLRVGPPRRHANLTLYPIFAEEVKAPEVDLTLDEAMERGMLVIRELEPPQVNRVRLVSKAAVPIFVMGGEMLAGAKQDRVVGDDVVVPPKADLVIPVFCVEQGRWVVKSAEFHTSSFLATTDIRKARAVSDQGRVWERVAAEQERLAAPSATGALRSLQDSREVQQRLEPYRQALAGLARSTPKARGVVACVGDEIVAADLFASRELFAALWPKLLDSYAIDAVGRGTTGRAPDGVQVKRWLDGLAAAERTGKTTPGDGSLFHLSGPALVGSAMVLGGEVVHVELFRTGGPEPIPFDRIRFRRERLEESLPPSTTGR